MYNTKRTWKIRDDDTIFDMMRMFNNLKATFQSLHDEMTRNYNMTVASMQWKPEWKEKLDLEGRPAFAYNLLRPVINVITSIELGNRKKIIAKPTSGGDAKLAEVVTQVIFYFLNRCNFDWHRTRVFLDAIIAKYGIYHIGWGYEDDPMGELIVQAIDPRRIMYELNYADPGWEKANYLFDKHQLSVEEVLNKFALNDIDLQNAILEEARMFFETDKEKSNKWVSKRLKALFSAVYEVVTGGNSKTEGPLDSKFLNWFDPITGKFDVLELHEKRIERRLLIWDSSRQKNLDVTDHVKGDDGFLFIPEKIDMVKMSYGIVGDPKAELTTKKFVTAVIPAFRLKVNEQAYPFNLKGYCYVPNYCYDYHVDGFRSQSVIDDLIDPQSDYNKARSTKLELLQRYVNKGWIVDENAIIGVEEDWETNRIAPYRRVRTGYFNYIKPEEGQTISPELIQETAEVPQIIEHISNAGASIRGRQEPAEKSGKHFIAKKQQEERSFAYIFNNVDNSTKAVGTVALSIIQSSVTFPRVFRITQDVKEEFDLGVNQVQYMMSPEGRIIQKVVNDITIQKYDITMDTTPYSSNAREMEFQKMSDLYNAASEVNPKKADAMLPIMVKAGDFPYADEILDAWAKMEGGDPKEQMLQQMMMQIQMIMAKLGIEEKRVDIKSKVLDNVLKIEQVRRARTENVLDPLYLRSGNRQRKPKQRAT